MNPAKTFKRFVVGSVQVLAVTSLLAGCTDSIDDPSAVDAGFVGDDPDLIVDPPLGEGFPDGGLADAGPGDAGPGSDAGTAGDAGTPGGEDGPEGQDGGVPGDGGVDGEDC